MMRFLICSIVARGAHAGVDARDLTELMGRETKTNRRERRHAAVRPRSSSRESVGFPRSPAGRNSIYGEMQFSTERYSKSVQCICQYLCIRLFETSRSQSVR